MGNGLTTCKSRSTSTQYCNRYKKMEGRCQCGAVRFKTDADKPLKIFICHCLECRWQAASSYGLSAIFPESGVHWLGSSRDNMTKWTRTTFRGREVSALPRFPKVDNASLSLQNAPRLRWLTDVRTLEGRMVLQDLRIPTLPPLSRPSLTHNQGGRSRRLDQGNA